METVKFHKTECGVDFLLNVMYSVNLGKGFLRSEAFNADFFEIVFISKGRGKLILDHQILHVESNNIIFISPFQKRQWIMQDGVLEFTALVFQEDFLNDFFLDKLFTYRLLYFFQLEHTQILSVENDLMQRYMELLFEIKKELVGTMADSAHIIRSLIYYLLQDLNRKYATQYDISFERDESGHAFQFKKLLETQITSKQRINDYLDLLKISRISLNKAVKQQFNVTAIQLLKSRLLIEVKNDLVYSKMSVSEIAFKFNFSETNHLMRFFKNQTGQTIGEYLTSYQNGTNS